MSEHSVGLDKQVQPDVRDPLEMPVNHSHVKDGTFGSRPATPTGPGLSRCLRGDAGLRCGGWDRTGVGNVGRLHTSVSDIKATEVIQSESLVIGYRQ